MRIGFCYNLKPKTINGASSALDFDFPETIDQIAQTIESLGHTVSKIEADSDVFQKLQSQKNNVDLVFNIAEGQYGDAREAWVPLACEILQIPYTHSGPTTQALCLDKQLAKLAVRGLGIRVPLTYDSTSDISYPVIIKPNNEGSSVGIFNANVVRSADELNAQLQKLRADGLPTSLLIEEYIDGREFTVGVLGSQVLPIIEQKFDFLPAGYNHIASYELKWEFEDRLSDLSQAYTCPADLTETKTQELQQLTKTIFSSLNMRDCARLDFRQNSAGQFYFIEANPLPGINPTQNQISYFPLAARIAGIPFRTLIATIINSAAARQSIAQP